MFMVGLLSWWYGRGWVSQWKRVSDRFLATVEFFSIGQLLSTLFSPYRQISAGTSSDHSLAGAFRSFVDRSISRVVGAFVRFFTVIFGIVSILLLAVYEAIVMLAWWCVPLLPVAGCILLAIGWVPLWR